MTTITQSIPSLGSPPLTSDPANFDSRADTLYGTSLPAVITATNTWSGQVNTVAGEVNTNATNAAASASSASGSASSATASASAASGSASSASASASTATTAANNAAASYDLFDDRFLGAKASDPTLDNDGNALVTGAIYFNTSTTAMRVYNGAAFQDTAAIATTINLATQTTGTLTTAKGGTGLSTLGTAGQALVVNSGATGLEYATIDTNATLGTLTKTFTANELSTISLTKTVLTPVVSVTKEVPQTGVTNNEWDVNSTTENYERLNSAPATTLNFVGFDVSTSVFVDAFSVSAQETAPKGIAFNPSGTKMFITGAAGKDINEYALSAAFDVSTATFTQLFSVNSQDTNPTGLCFNADGTKMFIVGATGVDVNEYALSTGFDISTASFTRLFSVSAQDIYPQGLAFSPDGTKMFVVGGGGLDVNEYTLSTGFNISTATFVDSFSVSAQDSDPKGLAFNADGTKMFIVGAGQEVNQYSLSTGFDVSTATFVKLFSISSQENDPWAIAFNPSGTKMFIVGVTGDDVNEYTLDAVSVALGTGSFVSADVGKTIEANSGVFVLTATSGAFVETTAPTSYNQVASGDWDMYGVVYNAVDGDLELSGFSSSYDIAGATFTQVLSVSAQDTSPVGIAFNPTGTKMFVVGYNGQDVNEYTLSTGFNISTASFVDSFSVASQETEPRGIAFNTTGTKMFICGSTGDDVNEYTLSTGFDVSTATFVDAFSISAQDGLPQAIAFNTNGTRMFIVGGNGQDVNQYALSTGFDVSTATFTQVFSVSAQDTSPSGIAFNTDGTQMFITGFGSDNVNKYNLSTAFDVSTASFVSSFSVAAQDTVPFGIAFSTDGRKMFVVGGGGAEVNEYSTGQLISVSGYQPVHTKASIDTTYWVDINDMTANESAGSGKVLYALSNDNRISYTVVSETLGARDIVRNNAGTWQYNSNGTYASETWTNATTNAELPALAQAMEGASFVVGFDVSTSVFVDAFSVSAQEADPCGLAFNTDGTKMFVCGVTGDDVNEYALSTGFDVSTAVFTDAFSVSAQATQPRGVAFNTDGTKMYVLSDSTGARFIYQYTLSTGFDVSTASYASLSFDVGSQDTSPQDIAFNSDGTKVFMVGTTNDSVYEYTLSTAFNISTATYVDAFSVTSEETDPRGLAFSTDGTRMFICGSTGDDVNEYVLSTGFDVSTASFVDSFSVSAEETSPQSIAFNANGTKMFIVGLNGVEVNEYTMGTTTYPNQMNKTQLDAVTDPNQITLGNDFDLAIIFNLTSGTTVPSSNGVSINYDANVLNEGAILGTDYDFDAPAGDKARITALIAGNYKVRVV
jgi:DNA-binding beta-propeller fold protein YncE